MLADLVRTDAHNHRLIAGDSTQVEAIKVLARAHQRSLSSLLCKRSGVRFIGRG